MTGCRATPDDLELKIQTIEVKHQNITLLLKFKKAPSIPLGDNLSGTAGQKTLRDAPVVVKLTAFFGDFFLLLHSVVCAAPEWRPVG